MTAPVIRADALTKWYGERRGIVDLTFAVAPGEVFGYLGPNGAGKTTTIRTLLDLIRPSGGRATLFGLDARGGREQIHRRTGYLPGEPTLWPNLTGLEHLEYLGNLRGGVDLEFALGLAERLDCDLSSRVKSLSHGNRQKVALIQAFMHRPDLLILDEPTQGLDPLVRQEFHRLVDETRAEGRTVFLSSHVLPEVERTCDRVGIIREGRLVAVEHISELTSKSAPRITITFDQPVPPDVFVELPGTSGVVVDGSVVRCSVTGPVDPLIKAAARFRTLSIEAERPTLEDVFLSFYGGPSTEEEPRG